MITLATSCGFTDLNPSDMVSPNDIYGSVDAVEQALIGVYAKNSWEVIIGASATLSDDVIKGGQNGGAHDESYQWTYTAVSGDHASIWAVNYGVISEANLLLDNVSGMKVGDSDTKRLNNCLGAAIFLRAYAHFDLLRFFADFNNPEALGVPYSKKPVYLETLPRNTVGECYDFLIEDLNEAISLLAEDVASDPGFVSKDAAKALLARVYLYKKDYAKAYETAKDVLARHPLASIADYPAIWVDESKKEIIYSHNCSTGDESIGTVFWWADNSSLFEPSKEILNIFDDNDIRKSSFFERGVDRDNTIINRVRKYAGNTVNVGLVDEKMMRSSEMQLIMIESKMNDDAATASKLLNDLRSKRISGWTTQNYSSEQLKEELILERRRELCYEGHRFFDMRRWNKPITKTLLGKTLGLDDIHRLMPIPVGEMQGNPVIADQQNPGYGD